MSERKQADYRCPGCGVIVTTAIRPILCVECGADMAEVPPTRAGHGDPPDPRRRHESDPRGRHGEDTRERRPR